ncbi:DUF1127 domain-containing protein [Histidinibacterium aquaticum]|uniref:DUF1127 domain-containing protein n=1 Tax=Histidinibacterium aquaticum TaxID=2613962 RepID=A0A5J5GR24_9RHOB|nr:DUF1127 domain-containing protein [Histidinibacterium aquaticum]KAA9009842.1 DUF1127 domain-containing protein [Histidinibacterium aquaticum]
MATLTRTGFIGTANRGSFIEAFKTRRSQNRVYRETLRELSQLTDRDLADLNISRHRIPDIARDAAYGS